MNNTKIEIISPKGLMIISFIIFCISCKKESKQVDDFQVSEPKYSMSTPHKPDSLSVSVNFKGKGIILLNFLTSVLDGYSIIYTNESVKDTIITRKVKRQPFGQDVFFSTFSLSENKIKSEIYCIGEEASNLGLTYDNGEIFLESESHVFNVAELEKSYRAFQSRLHKSKRFEVSDQKKQLRALFKNFETSKTINNALLKKVNTYYYINTLQKIDSFDEEIERFIYELKEPIVNGVLRSILYLYVQSRFELLDFNNLNTTDYPQNYIKNLVLGVYIYMEANKNNDEDKLKLAQNWLMSTEFYKEHKHLIDKNTTPFDKKLFTERLNNLNLLDSSFNKIDLAQIVKQNPSEYYLIDFWATWCGPCINGIKTMKTLTLPENIKVFSFSVNKMRVKEKWQTKSEELGLDISYLLQDSKKNKEFIKMVDLNWIPRYILVDNNLNLIDDKFPHPGDPNFLKGLKKLK